MQPTIKRPFVIAADIGKLRKGQVIVRRGSSTDGATIQELLAFFYGDKSDYFPEVVQRMQAWAEQQNAQTAYLRELRHQADAAIGDMEMITGVPLRRR